jgi:hypothetical protein
VVVGDNNDNVSAARGSINGAVVVGNDKTAVADGAGVGDQGSRNIAVVVASDAGAKAFNGDNNIAIAYADGASAAAGTGNNHVVIKPSLFGETPGL